MVGFNPVFEGLWKKEPVTCKTTNREFSGLPQPSVVIIDVCLFRFVTSRLEFMLLSTSCTVVMLFRRSSRSQTGLAQLLHGHPLPYRTYCV
jgi:hypothetical protein